MAFFGQVGAIAILALLITVASSVVGEGEANAQMGMKRSSGSLQRGSGSVQRSAGNRRGNDLGSRKSDSGSRISTSRKSTSDASDDDRRESDDEEQDSDRDRREVDSNSDDDSSSDADEESGDAHRTLGRACMYGVRGEVIFRPAGSTCRGDARESRPEQANRKRSSRSSNAPSRDRQPGPAALHRSEAAEKSTRAPTQSRATGRCIYGAKDRVIYAPAGVVCGR